MVELRCHRAHPTTGAPNGSRSSTRDAIQRANAAYLISHGLYPVAKGGAPTEGPPTFDPTRKRLTSREREVTPRVADGLDDATV